MRHHAVSLQQTDAGDAAFHASLRSSKKIQREVEGKESIAFKALFEGQYLREYCKARVFFSGYFILTVYVYSKRKRCS
jgi:hypothetical protein